MKDKTNIAIIVWANIRKIQMVKKYSDSELAIVLKVTTRTLYNYDSRPELLTLEKVQSFIDYADVDMDYLLK